MTDTIEALRSEVTDLQATIIRLTRELGEARDAEAAENKRLRQEVQDLMAELAYHGVYPK